MGRPSSKTIAVIVGHIYIWLPVISCFSQGWPVSLPIQSENLQIITSIIENICILCLFWKFMKKSKVFRKKPVFIPYEHVFNPYKTRIFNHQDGTQLFGTRN